MELVYFYDINMSVNSMYYSNPYKKGWKFLTREAKLLRAKIMDDTMKQMNGKEFWRGDILEVEVKFFKNWYTKEGNIRKEDLDNRIKFLLDSVLKAYDLDDSQIFKITAHKIHDTTIKQTQVFITKR